jgi:putative endonuclease
MHEYKNYYVYILPNKSNKVLYIGVTNDLVRRTFEHKSEVPRSRAAGHLIL